MFRYCGGTYFLRFGKKNKKIKKNEKYGAKQLDLNFVS